MQQAWSSPSKLILKYTQDRRVTNIYCAFTRDQLPNWDNCTHWRNHFHSGAFFFFVKRRFVTSLYIILQHLLRGEDKGNNEAIETQDFSEDQNEDHPHK